MLLLGIAVLWLSTEPLSRPGTETAGKSADENPRPLAASIDSRTEKDNKVARLEASPPSSKESPPPEKDSGFRPITPLGTSAESAPAEVGAPSEQKPGPPVSREGPAAVATAPMSSNAAPGAASSTGNAAAQSSVNPLANAPRSHAEPSAASANAEQPATPVTRRRGVEARSPRLEPSVASSSPAPTGGSKRPSTRQRPRAPAGRYETVMTATARSRPSDSAPIVDRIRRGTYLNVTGSEGDWLVVYSKRRNITVFVKRAEAMLTTDQPPAFTGVAQSDWPRVEETIRQAFARNNVTGVQVTFIGDTAYLKGTVKTDTERERAELFARSVLEVKHVFNGIRVE